MDTSDFTTVVGWWMGCYALGWSAGMLQLAFRRVMEQF